MTWDGIVEGRKQIFVIKILHCLVGRGMLMCHPVAYLVVVDAVSSGHDVNVVVVEIVRHREGLGGDGSVSLEERFI